MMTTPELIVTIVWLIGALVLSFLTHFLGGRDMNPPLICLCWMWPFMLFMGAIAIIFIGPAALGEYLGKKRS